MGLPKEQTKKLEILDYVQTAKKVDVYKIEVTQDQTIKQIVLKNEAIRNDQGGALVLKSGIMIPEMDESSQEYDSEAGQEFVTMGNTVDLEGDASVEPGQTIVWDFESVKEIVEEIRIDSEIRRSSEDIWSDPPKKGVNDCTWQGTVKEDYQLPYGESQQHYYLHYLLRGRSKWRRIDPIIRVNK